LIEEKQFFNRSLLSYVENPPSYKFLRLLEMLFQIFQIFLESIFAKLCWENFIMKKSQWFYFQIFTEESKIINSEKLSLKENASKIIKTFFLHFKTLSHAEFSYQQPWWIGFSFLSENEFTFKGLISLIVSLTPSFSKIK